ncbi:hypothetical protein ECRM12761_1245 [Escherichia coli O145:H28 str. RM12761]|uniref:Uncharacterized protein n=1 Tax=Escherichia coli O145:H28 (strain RM12581) TaxID=1248823 RepID=A0ABC7ZM25_ECOLR|nr:Hypothetical protein ECRM13514_0259 [Escherichia coli O145:H28 str. RM13514]AHG12945.1 hypothetical protein ECRM13516_0257 [Escherichia coli O145:H28 str. RM13516]AHY63286.1 hypothetical protein ECRM12761_1245 [Escherichia coli O145:H28 str. RM12761]AHY68781.1 Hypothetical protein ECRM12581_1255 [Escherichia coli O145:H28 str. RM12581]
MITNQTEMVKSSNSYLIRFLMPLNSLKRMHILNISEMNSLLPLLIEMEG